MHKRIARADGSVIILVPRRESKSVTISILYKVGSRHERHATNGASHFIEHMLFKGTRKRPLALDITREPDSVGADYNAFTGKDHTGYYIQVDSSHIELACEMLSDILHHSTFASEEVEREKGVIVEEMKMHRENPILHIYDLFETALFSGSSLGWNIAGSENTIRTFRRTGLVDFMQKYYRPGNAVIGIAGGFDEKHAGVLIDRYFAQGKRSSRSSIRPFVFKHTQPRVVLENRTVEQAQLLLGFPGYSNRHKNSEALLLLSVIMGGTMSSRLFTSIRERKGLAYTVRAWSESFEDTGYFAVYVGLDKNKIELVLAELKKEFSTLVKRGVTREELKRAKDNITGRLILKFEKPSVYLSYLMSQELLTGRIDSLEQTLKKIRRVSQADVLRVARSVVQWKKAQLALIGPFHSTSKFRTLLLK